jgi:hypothetical protein
MVRNLEKKHKEINASFAIWTKCPGYAPDKGRTGASGHGCVDPQDRIDAFAVQIHAPIQMRPGRATRRA